MKHSLAGRPAYRKPKRPTGIRMRFLPSLNAGGSARSFHVENVTKEDVLPIVRANIDRESHVMTDEAARYAQLGNEFADHHAVDHSRGEYGYTDRATGTKVHTNSIEGYYSVLQARHERRLSALQREALASLRCRVRFQTL